MKLKIGLLLILSFIFFILVLFLSGIIPLMGEYRTEFTKFVLIDYTIDLILHPISNVKNMLEDRNPLFILGMSSSFLLLIYMAFKMFRKKDYENVGDKYGVQGSARFARNKEIFNEAHIQTCDEKQIMTIIENSYIQE